MHGTRLSAIATLALGLAVSALTGSAEGAVIIGNMGGAYNTTGTASQMATTASKAIGFTITADVSVTALVLNLRDQAGAANSNLSIVSPRIYTQTSSGTYVGTLVGTFVPATPGNLTATSTNYTFNPSSAINLTSGSSYWLFLVATTSDTTDGYHWSNSSPTIAPTGSYATLTGSRFGNGTNQPTLGGGTSSNYNLFQLEGAVPEPATLGVLLPGVALLGLRRRSAESR